MRTGVFESSSRLTPFRLVAVFMHQAAETICPLTKARPTNVSQRPLYLPHGQEKSAVYRIRQFSGSTTLRTSRNTRDGVAYRTGYRYNHVVHALGVECRGVTGEPTWNNCRTPQLRFKTAICCRTSIEHVSCTL